MAQQCAAVLAMSPLVLHSLGRNDLNFLFLFRNNTAERRGAVSAQRRATLSLETSALAPVTPTSLFLHRTCINFFILRFAHSYFVISR